MSKQCCPKPNVVTFEDGTGYCQSCRAEYKDGERVVQDPISVEERATLVELLGELKQQVDELREETRDGKVELHTELASLRSRVTALEQGPPVS